MRRPWTVPAALLALALGTAAAGAQTLTGTIAGRVVDEQGGVLPGVTVTLTGRTGSLTTVTDGSGEYRFVGLSPGPYEVRTELEGFTPRVERNLDVGIGKTLDVDFSLKVGGLAERVEVVANASTIDVTSASTDNSLSRDLLANVPINVGNFNTAVNIMNYTPGINNTSAFGSDGSYSSALMIDGVDTRDPEGGSAWVFFNYNIVEEIQVGGLGAPAEYGGFTGAVVNTITKSGGNMYSGLFEVRHSNDSLASNNIKQSYIDLNPALADPSVITKLNDYTVQLGGPIRRDKAFFWGSVQRYAFNRDPAGPLTLATEVSPRFNAKLTFQLTPADTLIGGLQVDSYNVTGRRGKPPANVVLDNQTVRQDSPEAVWNTQYRKVFGSSMFLEAKYTGWWGYYYLDPVDGTPSRLDLGTGEYSGGGGYYYYADRGRNQVNVSLSKYAKAYGSHNFKFGVEIERSKSRSRYGYSDDLYYLDYYGAPYLAYSYSYDIDGRNHRESFYAQDQWKVGRLTANLGLRLDRISGRSPSATGTIYEPNLSWGPRLGVAVDASGKGTSVLKGFWGRYFEGASIAPYAGAVPGRSDYVTYEVFPGDTLFEIDRIGEFVYGIDDDIDHTKVDEFNVSFEQQIRRDMRFTASGIWRKTDNFVNRLIPNATWAPFAFDNLLAGGTLTLYRWVNRSLTEEDRFITNVKGYQYRDASGNVLAEADPKRDYKGFMFVLTKSYANRWQAQASYVWSEAKGTIDNNLTGPFGSTQWETPNGTVNADGFQENSRTHEFKLLGGYQLPKIEVNVSAYYRALSGRRYTPVRFLSGGTFNYYTSLNINLEPRGTERLPAERQLDLRFEKQFRVDVHRFSVFADFQNLLNTGTILARQTRFPSRTISGFPVQYNSPTTIVEPRQMTFGGRWSF
jgi:hypothetical protein